MVTLRQNSFIENFRGNSEGLVLEIFYFPYLKLQQNKFIRNGDIAGFEEFSWAAYSGLHLDTLSEDDNFMTMRSENAEILGDLMILIGGCLYLRIENTVVEDNWY